MSLIMLKDIAMPQEFVTPAPMTAAQQEQEQQLFEQAKECILAHKALLIAHYYTSPLIQRLAEETGGFIGDSLEMARVGKESPLSTIVVAGVRFMGETAKILSPEKTILMPDLSAECSLDLCCAPSELKRVKAEHPNATVVAYANTSAEVKALADWIVTSSLAVELADYLKGRGEEILWLPDRHLGSYIAQNANTDVYCWPGRCVVHDSFEAAAIADMKKQYPGAKVLVHPESSAEVVALADCVGSTSQLLAFTKKDDAQTYIVATERGIFYKMQQANPQKQFVEAAIGVRPGVRLEGANCPWMSLNSMAKIIECLEGTAEQKAQHEVHVPENVRVDAMKPLNRMLAFSAAMKAGNVPNDL